MISTEAVKRLINTPEWKALRVHMESHIAELDTIDGINFTDKESAAIEGCGRQWAIKKLNAILEPFVQYQKPSTNDGGVGDKAQDAGLD